MIVNCPKCSTKLSLDDSLIKGKKVKVRCAICQDIFSAGPLPDASLGMGADMDLDLNLDLSELGDLEAGLEDALSETPDERLSPLADSGDLDLNLPNLDDLEDGLESAMSPPGGAPQPAAPQAARPPEPPLIADEDTLGDLGDLVDDDIALAADEAPSAKPADDDMGELPDLAAEIADDLGGSALDKEKDEDTLDLDLDLDLPGIEDAAPRAVAPASDDEEDPEAVARALASVTGPDAGQEVDLSEPVTKEDLTLDLGNLEAPPEEAPLAAGDGELDLDLDMDLGAGEGALDKDLDLDLGDMGEGLQPEPTAAGGQDLDLGDLDLGGDEGPDLGATQKAMSVPDELGDLDTDFDLETPSIQEAATGEHDLAIDLDSFELTSDDADTLAAGRDAEQIPDHDKPVMEMDFDLEETMEMAPAAAARKQAAAQDFQAQEPTEVSAPPQRDLQETVALDRPFVDEVEQPAPFQEEELGPDQDTQESFAPEEDEAYMPPPVAPARNWATIGAVIVLVLAVVGIGGYFASKFLEEKEPVAVMAPADDMGIRNLTITTVAGHLEENETAGQIVVLRGTIKNEYPQARSNIQIYAELFDGQSNVVAEEWATAGIYIANQEFRSQSMQELVDRFTGKLDPAPMSIKPGEEAHFTVIFFNPPQNVSEYAVQPIGSSPAGI